MIFIGNTCEELKTRLKWHIANNKSQFFKHKDKKPKIEQIINAPSNDKKNQRKLKLDT